MRRVLIAVAAIVVVAVGAIVFVAMPDDDDDSQSASRFRALERSYVGGSHRLEIGGADVGVVKVVSLGGPFAEAVESRGTDAQGQPLASKHPGPRRYADIVVDISGGISKPLAGWIAGTLAGASPRIDGAIHALDANGQSVSRTVFTQALLAGVQTPVCDAASKDPQYFRLTIIPSTQETGPPGPVGKQAAAKGTQALSSNCRLTIPGVDTSKVSKIDTFAIKQTVTDSASSDAQGQPITQKSGGLLDLANFRAEFAEVSVKSWMDWFADLVINGNHANEKTAKIEWLDPTLKSALATVDLGNCGVIRLQPASAPDNSAMGKWSAEVYCESATIKLGS